MSLLLVLLAQPATAQNLNSGAISSATSDRDTETVWRVGIKEAPPFSYRDAAGKWQGISVVLWQQIAADTGLKFQFVEQDLQGLLDGVSQGRLAAAVGALTITAEREKRFNFSHSFFNTGLGVAVRKDAGAGFFPTLRHLLEGDLWRSLATIVAGLAFFTGLIAFCERRYSQRFPDHPGKARADFWSSLWWNLVILIGKNDSHPISPAGRILALSWMVVSLVIVASLTAVLTSALTLNELQTTIKGPRDLAQVRLVSIPSSSSADYLQRERIRFREVATIADGLQQVVNQQADAMVYDRALLRYLVTSDFDDQLEVLNFTFEHQSYGIAVSSDRPELEAINQSLLVRTRVASWNELLFRYLGE